MTGTRYFDRLLVGVALAVTVATIPVLSCFAQEVGSIDLTQVAPRLTEVPAGIAGRRRAEQEFVPCRSHTNVGALRTTLVSLDRSRYHVGDQPIFEVQIENIGTTPVQIPFSASPTAQPSNLAHKFAYSQLVVGLWLGGTKWGAGTGGDVTLFGDNNHPGTVTTLHPGEWVRVIGKGHISLPDDFSGFTRSGDTVNQAYARVAIYDNEVVIAVAGTTMVSRAVCLSQTQGPSLPFDISPR